MRYPAIIVLSIFCLLFYSVYTASARPSKRYDERTKMCRVIAAGTLDWESEPWGIGGIKFREVCKSCHALNNDQGAPFVHAESYTSNAWNVIFSKRNEVCALNGSWDVLSEDELQMVNDYLFRNGNWTYDPNNADSCG
ncbi:MAG: hypothetical protein K9K37_00180 [Desulfocapsa sp.]|nr:hypothetical protein [Desulfocapsa sp.]